MLRIAISSMASILLFTLVGPLFGLAIASQGNPKALNPFFVLIAYVLAAPIAALSGLIFAAISTVAKRKIDANAWFVSSIIAGALSGLIAAFISNFLPFPSSEFLARGGYIYIMCSGSGAFCGALRYIYSQPSQY